MPQSESEVLTAPSRPRRQGLALAPAAWVLACCLAFAVLLPGAAPAAVLPLQGDLAGSLRKYLILPGDTFVDVAERFDLGYVELLAANPGVDPWIPDEGSIIVLPTAHLLPEAPHRGIVINLPELRLYYYARAGEVWTFPLGIGSEGNETPEGRTRVVRKQKDPSWYPPASIRAERPWLPEVVRPGPDNPLGDRALYLGWPRYAIHGTNRPAGVGRRVSHGCIRLYPEDITALFQAVRVGTPVTVVDQPVKLGWVGDELFIEVHPTQAQADEIEATGRASPDPIGDLTARVTQAAGSEADRLDWAAVDKAAAHRSGLPVQITRWP